MPAVAPCEPRAGSVRPRVALVSILLLAMLTGCQVHTHRVGAGPTGVGEESARQYYILFGLLQLNEVNVQRMASDLTGYDIETEFSWLDFFLMPVFLPLTITSRTVTVYR